MSSASSASSTSPVGAIVISTEVSIEVGAVVGVVGVSVVADELESAPGVAVTTTVSGSSAVVVPVAATGGKRERSDESEADHGGETGGFHDDEAYGDPRSVVG